MNDDVRRAAVISLGLVFANEPSQLPKVLRLLSQSYNPHVRYAVCLALGIGCPGMAASVPEALALMEPLLTDVSEFVRQGALIGMGLLCQETSGKQCDGKVEKFREKLAKMPGDKHEDVMCRFGALISAGLIDLGGRNASVPLVTRSGSLRMGAAVGFCLFAQMWYWYPLMLMISLAVTPTALVGLTGNLKMPKRFAVKSKTTPSTFAYPPEHKVESKGDKSRLVSAVLSAAKAKKKEDEKVPDVEMAETAPAVEEPVEPEATEEILFNPCRVVVAQEPFISALAEGELIPAKDGTSLPVRYVPVLPNRVSGFVVVRDLQPSESEDLLEFGGADKQSASVDPNASPAQESPPNSIAEAEAPPPEAFEWEG